MAMKTLSIHALCFIGAGANAGMYGYHVTGSILYGCSAAVTVLCAIAAVSILIVREERYRP